MPIQTPAIFRLLLTVLYGLYPGGPSLDEWHELWNDGLSDDDIIDYLDQYADRWNLFDERMPFLQVADLRTEKGTYSGLEKLIFDVPNGAPVLHHASRRGITAHSLRRSGTLAGHRSGLRPIRHQIRGRGGPARQGRQRLPDRHRLDWQSGRAHL